MPTHWESSKRPLFVRTVLVNGSRHAILTQEDPLGQTVTTSSKNSRPDSAHSSSGSSSTEHSVNEIAPNKSSPEKAPTKSSKDLQACLVKLQLVLATQSTKKSTKSAIKDTTDDGNKKRKRISQRNHNKKTCDWHESTQESAEPEPPTQDPPEPTSKYNTNQNITVASFFTSEPQKTYAPDHTIERITGHLDYPEYEAFSSYDVPWNGISTESYFTRPFHNRLSERVFQWLDMANKNKPKVIENKTETVERKQRPERTRRVLVHQESSEDNSEEVRVEEDVDTALSREYPKFTQELNRLHYLKSSIPVKQETYSAQLQESIAQSFTTVVSIRSGKYAIPKSPKKLHVTKKGHLTRQIRLEESSDDDETPIENFQKNNYPVSQLSYTVHNKIPWLREPEINKPQLHIFIPVITETEPDSASEVSHVSN